MSKRAKLLLKKGVKTFSLCLAKKISLWEEIEKLTLCLRKKRIFKNYLRENVKLHKQIKSKNKRPICENKK